LFSTAPNTSASLSLENSAKSRKSAQAADLSGHTKKGLIASKEGENDFYIPSFHSDNYSFFTAPLKPDAYTFFCTQLTFPG